MTGLLVVDATFATADTEHSAPARRREPLWLSASFEARKALRCVTHECLLWVEPNASTSRLYADLPRREN